MCVSREKPHLFIVQENQIVSLAAHTQRLRMLNDMKA